LIEIDQALSALLSLINCDNTTKELEKFECTNFNEIIQQIVPPNIWKNDIYALCEKISTAAGDVSQRKIKYLVLQSYFFNSLSLYFDMMSTILSEFSHNFSSDLADFPLGLCVECKAAENEDGLTKVLQCLRDCFYFKKDPFFNSICDIENCDIKNLQAKIEFIFNLHKQIPLTTQFGQRVAFIPGDSDYNIFIGIEEGDFFFPTYEHRWDFEKMERVPHEVLLPVVIDESTGSILSPPQFFGQPKPEMAYIAFEDIYNDILENTEKSKQIIEKIYKQVED
jgi:hypothetical protein